MRRTVNVDETIHLAAMRAFATVVERASFTRAAAALGLPKQTVSRRVAELEEALGVRLLERTTRRVSATEAGADYARRCAEVLRLADDAAASVHERSLSPRGVLRVTADPVLGERFVTPIVLEYLRRHEGAHVEVVLTRRKVDLAEEGFDVAFRIGGDAGVRLGPARIRYCASPAYLASRGTPKRPEDLAKHECIVVASEGVPVRWPFRTKTVAVSGRFRTTSFEQSHAAMRAGLGIGIAPELAVEADLAKKKLVSVLDAFTADAGGVWLLTRAGSDRLARVRAFVELVGPDLSGWR